MIRPLFASCLALLAASPALAAEVRVGVVPAVGFEPPRGARAGHPDAARRAGLRPRPARDLLREHRRRPGPRRQARPRGVHRRSLPGRGHSRDHHRSPGGRQPGRRGIAPGPAPAPGEELEHRRRDRARDPGRRGRRERAPHRRRAVRARAVPRAGEAEPRRPRDQRGHARRTDRRRRTHVHLGPARRDRSRRARGAPTEPGRPSDQGQRAGSLPGLGAGRGARRPADPAPGRSHEEPQQRSS